MYTKDLKRNGSILGDRVTGDFHFVFFKFLNKNMYPPLFFKKIQKKHVCLKEGHSRAVIIMCRFLFHFCVLYPKIKKKKAMVPNVKFNIGTQ